MVKICSIAFLLLLITACSSTNTAPQEAKEKTSVSEDSQVVVPKIGEISFTLPQGWIKAKLQPSKTKDTDSISFTRKVDQQLWADPGPAGTLGLPVMNIMVSLRPDSASKDDIEPKKLGQSLIKQKVFAELVEAEYIEIAGKQATKVVGDTPTRERNFIILLANNGYLYKWTLYGLRPNDAEPVASLQQLLSSVTIKGK